MSWMGMTRVALATLLLTACRFDPAGLGDDTSGDASTGDRPDSAAEPPLGTGKDGELTVTSPTTVNVYTAVVEPPGLGATRISVASIEGFAAGDLVLLHHAAGMAPEEAPSGDQTALVLDEIAVGEHQLVRLAAVEEGELVLDAPTTAAFPAVSQVVRVPELSRLGVGGGGAIVAPAWDGQVGGVIAVLVTGTATIDGAVDAGGAGFRGGAPGQLSNGPSSCQALDGTAAQGGGAPKGEGLVAAEGAAGRGNLAHAGGGGNCHNAGGGGGGGGGRGGDGGATWAANEPLGGMGGAALAFDADDRLAFGGGGGAGEDNDDQNDGRGGGGAGGGIVLIRARAFVGGGEISASGAPGGDSSADGGGGGGGGGTIHVYAVDGIALDDLIARGGAGGRAGDGGSGGGGGGGRIVVEAGGPLSTPLATQGGAGGSEPNLGASGSAGVSDVR